MEQAREAFRAFEKMGDDCSVWEHNEINGLSAINYDICYDMLAAEGVKDPDPWIEFLSDAYGMDVD